MINEITTNESDLISMQHLEGGPYFLQVLGFLGLWSHRGAAVGVSADPSGLKSHFQNQPIHHINGQTVTVGHKVLFRPHRDVSGVKGLILSALQILFIHKMSIKIIFTDPGKQNGSTLID